VAGDRDLPFTPRSAVHLKVGDLIGVPSATGRWGCLQVTDIESGSRKFLYVGLLDWSGERPPTAENTASAKTLDSALSRMEMFSEGGLQVFDNRPVIGVQSNRTEFAVGTVHRVKGWKAAIGAAEARADA